jgi:hypothetical protein
MTHILLTGAGFSRNWGGWLANEAFEYLLGCPEIDAELRLLLWRSKENGGGFEETLAELQDAYSQSKSPTNERRLSVLTGALVGMFNEMSNAFEQRPFEPQSNRAYMVRTFLNRFDLIFTLNQDTLLEQHYLDDNVQLNSNGKWNGWQIPGTRPLNQGPVQGSVYDKTTVREPTAPGAFRIEPGMQPYLKLHGSRNWVAGQSGGRILIMGGNKAVNIKQFPLLSWYHEEFQRHLFNPGTRLMVIGYSFSDAHINDAIASASDAGSLKIYIVDPLGVDVIDKRRPLPLRIPDPYMVRLTPNIIGASRRPLTAIFNDDVVEHGKLTKFFS